MFHVKPFPCCCLVRPSWPRRWEPVSAFFCSNWNRLLASSSVMVIPLTILHGEHPGGRAWGGALLAFTGIVLLFR